MQNKTPVTVIILTFNEEIHIERVLNNVCDWAQDIFILDSYSTDRTTAIARNRGAKVVQRAFDTYANQRNFAIKELPIDTEWVFFLDADEYLTDELQEEISNVIDSPRYDGYYIKRRFYFMGRWIKHGGYYPIWILRLFKKDCGYVSRDINEHVVVKGNVGYLKNDFVDHNLKGIYDWMEKHNRYSTYEAGELVHYRDVEDPLANLFGNATERKRWIRRYVWNPLMPILLRPFIYFIYRYILRGGFIDGIPGFIYHFLHGCVYRFLIDIKYLELKRRERGNKI
jgi:glycosyltransferase involved in cell wall biosynthesis